MSIVIPDERTTEARQVGHHGQPDQQPGSNGGVMVSDAQVVLPAVELRNLGAIAELAVDSPA